MKEYEILFIIKPNLSEDRYKEIIENFKIWITKNEGEIIAIKPWGIKDLPKTFKKFTKGYFVESQFKATSKTLDALNKNIRVTEDIVRELIVTLESITNPKPKKPRNQQ